MSIPSLDTFLAAPLEEIRPLAPKTVVYAYGGTRRQAVLNGITPHSAEYLAWSRESLMRCLSIMFDHGAQHIFTALFTTTQARNIPHERRLQTIQWIADGIASSEMLEFYRSAGWRVRLMGVELVPELADVAARFDAETAAGTDAPTLWWFLATDRRAMWDLALSAAQQRGARSLDGLLTALYGECVPTAGLYLASGKPMLTPDLIPPWLIEETHCYWDQGLGYTLTPERFRRILYDLSYTRATSTSGVEKDRRAFAVQEHADVWRHAGVLGIGQRIGPFWFPETPFEAPGS